MTITRITAIPVIVPMRPGTVNSPDYDQPPAAGKRDAAQGQLAYDAAASQGTGPHAMGGLLSDFDDLVKFILRVETDEGLIGVGETFRAASWASIERNRAALIGCDPRRLDLRALPFPYDRAYIGFEVALYDLLGKAFGVPVHHLLGGRCRDRVRVDYWTGQRTPEDIARIAREAVAKGFTGLKFKCALEDPNVERVQAIHDAVGHRLALNLDPNERFYQPADTIRLARRLDGYNIAMFESPVPQWNIDWYIRLRRMMSIPVAFHIHLPYGGTERHLITAIKRDAVDYVNISGGVSAFIRMATVCDMAGLLVWHGSEVDLGILDMAAVHAAAATPNCTLGSDLIGNFLREDDLIVDPIRFEGEWAQVPAGPGLGVELDDAAVRRYAVGEWS